MGKMRPNGTPRVARQRSNADVLDLVVRADDLVLQGHQHAERRVGLLGRNHHAFDVVALTSHKVIEKKLAKPLVLSCGYWLDSMKPEFRNRDKAPAQVGELEVDTSVAKGVPTTY